VNTKKFQALSDKLINKIFLWAVPSWVKPNFFTWVRIATVPPLFWLLFEHHYPAALILFAFSASTDFIDGALARTRDQITQFGEVLDPIADKLLIATVLAVLGIEYVIVQIFLVFIGLEILAIVFSSFLAYKIGRPPAANFFGKVKMILQSAAVLLLLPGLILESVALIDMATFSLGLALIFAILSAYRQVMAKINNVFKFLNLDKSIQTLKNLLKKV
jgi:CDP-diacylglycerol---glycerol-3-phosphate 3-phosphatidyltransferase